MLAGLGMMLHVIIAPNSAFAEIRDNAGRYFLWSLGIVVFLGILFTVIDPGTPLAEYQSNIATGIATSILGSFVSTAVIYLLGRLFGGNKNWKQVFSVIFYTEIIAIPLYVASTLWGQTSPTASWDFFPWVVVIVPLIVWVVVVMVKAVKVVNGFGTAKAFGLILLAGVITLIVYGPLIVIWYFQDIIAAL